jgi:hypothetical protein
MQFLHLDRIVARNFSVRSNARYACSNILELTVRETFPAVIIVQHDFILFQSEKYAENM